jgi:hypothetical protein
MDVLPSYLISLIWLDKCVYLLRVFLLATNADRSIPATRVQSSNLFHAAQPLDVSCRETLTTCGVHPALLLWGFEKPCKRGSLYLR